MISLRHGMFETNSSSNHVFVYRPDSIFPVSKTITFYPDKEDTIRDIFFNDHYQWYKYDPKCFEDEMVTFLVDVLAIGVEEIKCSDKRVEELVEKIKTDEAFARRYAFHTGKTAMRHILFDEEVQLTTLDDYDVCDETIGRKYGPEYDYYSVRLS